MKKNLLLKVFAVALVALAFISCKKEVQPTGVKLNQTILALETGATANLIATVEPAGAVGTVSWSSSNDAVASIANGVVTAKSAGSATITATISTFSATCSVTVTDPYVKVSSVELNKSSLELVEGDAAQLTATVKPDNATDKTVTWKSSDAKIATVSASGEVVAVAEGKATITASAGDASASCEVAVAKKVIAVESVTLDKTAVELTEGETATLTATVKPDDATDKSVTWTSDNTAVATVADGVVTAVAEGTAKITAKAGDASAVCAVTVKKKVIAVESVTLDKTSLELSVGGTGTLTATVKPDNATDKTITWSCDNSAVATVADGVVTAVAAGTAKVTAKAGEATAVCTVTVKADVVKVTEITINEADFSLAVGETKTLTVTVKPDNASDKSVTWTSDQPGIASVNSNGVVTAVAAGNAKITVKANGGDVSDFVNVTVTAGNNPIITYLGKQKNSVGNYFDVFDISNTNNSYFYYDCYSESSINENGGIEAVMSSIASEIESLLNDYSVEDLLDYGVLAQGDGKYSFKAIEIGSYYMFLLAYDSNGKYIGPTYLKFNVTEYPWKKLGTGKYTDDVACGIYQGLFPKTVKCNVYESKETPGIYMINGFQLPLTASIFGVSEEEMRPYTGYWRNSDIIINASDPNNVFIELQDYGVCLNPEDGFIDGLTSLYNKQPVSVGTLDNNTITFKTAKGLLCTFENEPGEPYYTNRNGKFKLVIPKSNNAPSFSAPAWHNEKIALKKGKLATKIGGIGKADLNRY